MRNQRLRKDAMEHGTLEREIHVDASPEVVFEVISRPEHIQEWWSDEARFESASGELIWRDADTGETMVAPLTIVEVDPPRRFSFRWTYTEPNREGNSLLVTFDLIPGDAGTTIRMTETGFREMGWEIAVLEEHYRDHEEGWDRYLPELAAYISRLATRK